MTDNMSLIAELEEALKSGSRQKRVTTLRRVTDLFLNDCGRLIKEQAKVVDDVLGHLIQRSESGAQAHLTTRRAPTGNAPIEVAQRLARDDEIKIPGPVLSQSNRLSDADLMQIAEAKSQKHL